MKLPFDQFLDGLSDGITNLHVILSVSIRQRCPSAKDAAMGRACGIIPPCVSERQYRLGEVNLESISLGSEDTALDQEYSF